MDIIDYITLDRYKSINTLGSGCSSIVKLCEKDNVLVAIKVMTLKSLDNDLVKSELNNHSRIDHPNIVKMHHYFYNKIKSDLYIVLDYCKYKDLEVIKKNKKIFSVEEIRYCMKQIFSAVNYLHSLNIIHRDLKLLNILVDENKQLKLADFGFSLDLNVSSNENKHVTGTYNYIPPEILKKEPYSKYGDIWSLGIMMYIMCYGKAPFIDISIKKLLNNICILKYTFPENRVNEDLACLIKKILVPVDDRISMLEIETDIFFNGPSTQLVIIE
jgi:serine/threonine protein kinase